MKRVIPPVLFLICIALMLGIRNTATIQEIVSSPFNYIGIIPGLLGLMMTVKVRKQFSNTDTEVHTFKKPRKLVTNGLFEVSRNPIYLGFMISLVGVWILLGTLLPILGCLLFFLVSNSWYVPYEERTMEELFGREYRDYKSKVRRWV